MGAGLNNFTNAAVPNEFGHPATTAAIVDPEAPRSERLATLLRHGLADGRALAEQHGLRRVPTLVGVPSDLSADEESQVQKVLQDQAALVGEVALYRYGRASTFAALAGAKGLLGRGGHRFAIVVGVDSLCAPATVAAHVQAGRVLSPFTEGTIPGEACALALLANSEDSAVDPSAAVRLEALAVERELTPFLQARVVSSEALTTIFRSLRKSGAKRVHRIIGAHSGEGYFGRSFAHAYLREVELMPEPLVVELISDRVGDTGAAAGLVGVAFAAYLMAQDGRDGLSRALIFSESDTGEVGAAIIEGASTSWQQFSGRVGTGDQNGNVR